MPFSTEGVEPGIGLALSGGGFRATLFHLGSLWRLNELGILSRLDRISSVSGGSITAGYLGLRWRDLRFDNGVASNFVGGIVAPLREFCTKDIDIVAVGKGALLPRTRVSDVVDSTYRKHLFGDAKLSELPDKPRFVINATNFGTGVSFRFSKPYAGDYRIGLIENPGFRISQAVTASSAFPPVLSPVVIEPNPDSFTRTPGADLYDDRDYRKRLVLTDGGVYDNLGLETVWNRYGTVLVSDAGAPFEYDEDCGTAWAPQSLRALDIATNQARALRKRALIHDFQAGVRQGAYWGIGTDIAKYGVADSLPCAPQRIRELAAIRTRLNCFSEEEQCRLINWGYAVSDAALRRFHFAPAAPAPQWPYPNYRL